MYHLALIVFEENLDLDLALFGNFVLHRVRTVILVVKVCDDLRVVTDLCDLNLEVIATRLTVFTKLVTGLNDELGGVSNSAFMKETGSIGE
jgi:hypothetical protein